MVLMARYVGYGWGGGTVDALLQVFSKPRHLVKFAALLRVSLDVEGGNGYNTNQFPLHASPFSSPSLPISMSKRHLLLLPILILLLLSGCEATDRDAAPTSPPHATSTALASLTPSPTPASASPASAQHLLVLPDDGPEPVLDLIHGAQESIRFKIYLFTYREVQQALIRAAQRGVEVRVLIDPEPVGGGESNAATARRLKEGDVEVKWAPGAFKHNHEKSMVVDDRIALIATFNATYSSFTQNREFAILTTQPDVVADVAAIFDADWAGEGVSLSDDSPLVLSPVNSRERITALIQGARESLWLEEATLLDDDITQALTAAAQRGVDVRFIAPLREQDAAADNYQTLKEAGARVVFLPEPYVHAKAILADDARAFIGSVNLSYTSFELNRELGIITEDEGVVTRLAQVMARDWNAASREAEEDKAAPAPAGTISWQEAEDHVGEQVTVQGEIVRTYDTGKVTFLNFDDDYRNTLTLVLFPGIYDAFPQPPASYFKDKTVRVTGEVKLYEGAPEIIIEDPAQIQVAGEASAADEGLAGAPQRDDLDTLPLISWQDAGRYVGREVIVEGDVVRTYYSGKAAFLNFDANWRETLSVVIFASDFDAFPQRPDKLYRGRRIRVRGKIKEYKGAPEIIVESPDQIDVLAGDLSPAAEPPKGVVSWQEAGRYVGQTITVEGRIVRTKDIGSITFLNFGKKRGDFTVVIRAEDYDHFPAPPAELYRGKKVWVTGEVNEYKGTPQIIVHSPKQIETFE